MNINRFGTTASALIAGTEWSDLRWDHLWIYFVAPLIGSVLSAILFKFLYQDYSLDHEVSYMGERGKHQVRRYMAEFLGSMYLVLIIKLVSAEYNGIIPNISAACGIGFALICLVYQHGYISQCHMNPS